MSRSGYIDDYCDDNLQLGRWRAQVMSAIRGKRGQNFLRDLINALEALQEKRLISNDLQDETGQVCALGSVGIYKKIDLSKFNPDDPHPIASTFNIAPQLVQEIEYLNDEWMPHETPEDRWKRMHEWAKRMLTNGEINERT